MRGQAGRGRARRAAFGVVAAAAGAFLGATEALAQAKSGAGIPRITFAPEEVGKRIHIWTDLVGRVPFVMMHQGNLLVFQHRARKISAFDITDPKAPKVVHEAYGQGGQGDEHTVITVGNRMLASGTLMEWSGPTSSKVIGTAPLYLSVWPGFQWPYLYNTRTYDTDGKSSPLAVYDWRALGTPRLVKSIDAVSQVGFTTGTAIALGNLLLVASGDVYAGVAVYDISNPAEPVLLGVNKSGPAMYTGQHYGKWIVTTGPKGVGKTGFFDITDPENIRLEYQEDIRNMRDYAHFQNGYMFGSQSGKIIKYDMTARKTVLTADVPASPNGAPRPFRYCVPLGNLLFLGDPDDGSVGVGDGRTGKAVGALFVHQARPDSIGPSLLFNDPPAGALRVPLTSRIGLAFDESVDERLLDLDHIQVRPEGGAPIAGEYGHAMGAVNFTPREPLRPNTTYEVFIPAGAVKDYTGNASAKAYAFRFSTGATITNGLPGRGNRATFWMRPRLAARPSGDGAWRLSLAGWEGPLTGRARITVASLSGRSEILEVPAAELRRGLEWRPSGRLQGPLVLQAAWKDGEARGMLMRRDAR